MIVGLFETAGHVVEGILRRTPAVVIFPHGTQEVLG